MDKSEANAHIDSIINPQPRSFLSEALPEESMLMALARDVESTDDMLNEIIRINKDYSGIVALSNPNLSGEGLRQYSVSNNYLERAAVAINPSASEELLVMLSKDKRPFVRLMVVMNPSISEERLERLSVDAVESVRKAALKKASERG